MPRFADFYRQDVGIVLAPWVDIEFQGGILHTLQADFACKKLSLFVSISCREVYVSVVMVI